MANPVKIDNTFLDMDLVPVEEINDRLIDDFETFRGSHHLNDDVTYGIMKFAEQEVVL